MNMVTLPEAVLFGTMIGLALTGLLVGKENEPVARLRYTDVYQLYRFDSCLRRNGCACRVVRGMTMKVIGLLCLLAATVCVACAFVNKE